MWQTIPPLVFSHSPIVKDYYEGVVLLTSYSEIYYNNSQDKNGSKLYDLGNWGFNDSPDLPRSCMQAMGSHNEALISSEDCMKLPLFVCHTTVTEKPLPTIYSFFIFLCVSIRFTFNKDVIYATYHVRNAM